MATRDEKGLTFATDVALEDRAGRPWVLPAVLLLAAGLRVAHLLSVRASPFFATLTLDARYYDQWAQRIAGGEWIGRQSFWVDPLYAYVLGIVYAVGGHDLLLPRLLNLACGVLTVWLVARIARRVWGSELAAVAAALAVALFVPAIHFEAQVEKTALSVLLLAAALDAFLLGSLPAIAFAGIATGLSVLARGNALALVPLAALALALGWDREPGDPLVRTAGQRWQRAGVFLVTAVPLILLATLHNYAASGELVPTTTNLGINLYLGNHAGNQYGYYEPPDFLHPSTDSEVPDFRAEAARRGAGTLSDRALSDYWAGAAVDALRADPGLAVARTVHKLQLALNDEEVPDSEDVAIVAAWSPLLRAPLLWFGQLLALATLGAVVGWRRRAVRVLVAVALVYLASLLPFFIFARLRVQLLPPLAVLGGGALAWLAAALRVRPGRPVAIAAAILAVAWLVAWYQPAWMAQRRIGSLAIGWHNMGAGFADQGRRQEARDAFARAAAIDPAAVPASLRMLATYYREDGDYVRAEETLRQLIAVRPDSRSARTALDSLYATMLADPRWRDDAALARRRAAFASGGSGSAAPPPAAAAPAAKPGWQLSGDDRASFVAALAGQPQGTPAWIAYDGRDPSAHALAQQLAGAFEAAGWSVRALVESPFPLRAGLFVFAADETPSPAAAAATVALEAAHLPAAVASGYRDYASDRRRANPNWSGFQLAADQEFLIAVGRPGP
ncbi:MAG TPA: glycosyltransferase family 39 protein [Candidatus Dormibacteraeota bacterium]|nr:glycosyltransferase family 39 protein [Candidatus Dormibacteraeota bacterium]